VEINGTIGTHNEFLIPLSAGGRAVCVTDSTISGP
jgi:hypothetical protein